MSTKLTNLLLPGLLLLASCSQGSTDDPRIPAGADAETSVELVMSRAAKDDFAAAGVDSYTVYVYKVDRKTAPLYLEKTVSVDDASVTLSLPLGENFKTFAVANAASVSGKDLLETAELHLDPASDKEVWFGAVTSFASDKSTATVALSLQRLVARVDFTPAETEAELAGQTYFDRIALSFSNTASSYTVATGTATAATYTVETTAAAGYKASFITFDTNALDAESLLDMTFYKGTAQVNTSAGALETGVKYTANNRYTMTVPVLANDFVATPWTAAAGRSAASIEIEVSPF